MSRGLGDVYKRQPLQSTRWLLWLQASRPPVSYTHLTLPTKA
ncbi:hypothetical protein JMUB7529_28410 [Staphylococcus aureus]